MTDDELSRQRSVERRFVDGDEAAFEAIYRDWRGHVYRWALRIVRNRHAAEDVTAEAFWRAYRSRATFDLARDFGAWMRRIATNAAIDRLQEARRDAGRHVPLEFDVAAEQRPSGEIREEVAAAIARLSPKLRAVVLLMFVEGESYAEIADALGLSMTAVRLRMFRAVRQLRRYLDRSGLHYD
jgi:RNA polymerase sigma-70 factor (ECF subfamily)